MNTMMKTGITQPKPMPTGPMVTLARWPSRFATTIAAITPTTTNGTGRRQLGDRPIGPRAG
jgi:hypothetical protein